MKKLLFLCTGNYYRSRFAECLFNLLAEKRGLNWRAFSRGLAIERGVNNIGAMSRYTREALTLRGHVISEDERSPLQVLASDFSAADKIIALDDLEHRPLMVERFPDWAEAIEYWSVCDVDKTPAAVALVDIEQRVERLISLLDSGSENFSTLKIPKSPNPG